VLGREPLANGLLSGKYRPGRLVHCFWWLALAARCRRRRGAARRGRTNRGDRSSLWRAARALGAGLVPTAPGRERGDSG